MQRKPNKLPKRCKGGQEVANGVLLTSTQCQFRSFITFITQPTNSVNTMLLLSLEDARLQILLGQRDTLLILFVYEQFLTTETRGKFDARAPSVQKKARAKSGPRVCLKCCTMLLLKVQILYRASVSSSNVQILYHAAMFQVQQNGE